MTPEQAMQKALEEHPDCRFAESTIVIKLWRNQECYLQNDPPKYEKSYPKDSKVIDKIWRILQEKGYAHPI